MSADIEVSFARLAVEHWKLLQVLNRLVPLLPFESQDRVRAQARFAASQLNALVSAQDFQLATFEGRRFEPNLPVTAINSQDFSPDSCLQVSATIEPTVVSNGRIIQLGKVALSEEAPDASRN